MMTQITISYTQTKIIVVVFLLLSNTPYNFCRGKLFKLGYFLLLLFYCSVQNIPLLL